MLWNDAGNVSKCDDKVGRNVFGSAGFYEVPVLFVEAENWTGEFPSSV